MRDLGELNGHGVGGDDGADAYGVIVGAAVAHDADGAHAGEDGEVLPNFPFHTGVFDLFAENIVAVTEDRQLFLCDLAEDTNAEAGAGEGLTPDERRRHAERLAYRADLILEEGAQGL